MKQPFRLDSSLFKDDPDYFTAVYSSNIHRFQYLFDELRDSRKEYFTPSERSLLTCELLSRVHYSSYETDAETSVIEQLGQCSEKIPSFSIDMISQVLTWLIRGRNPSNGKVSGTVV